MEQNFETSLTSISVSDVLIFTNGVEIFVHHNVGKNYGNLWISMVSTEIRGLHQNHFDNFRDGSETKVMKVLIPVILVPLKNSVNRLQPIMLGRNDLNTL